MTAASSPGPRPSPTSESEATSPTTENTSAHDTGIVTAASSPAPHSRASPSPCGSGHSAITSAPETSSTHSIAVSAIFITKIAARKNSAAISAPAASPSDSPLETTPITNAPPIAVLIPSATAGWRIDRRGQVVDRQHELADQRRVGASAPAASAARDSA